MKFYHIGPIGLKVLKPSIPSKRAPDEPASKHPVVCLGESPEKCIFSIYHLMMKRKVKYTLYRIKEGQEDKIFPASGFADSSGEYRSYSDLEVEELPKEFIRTIKKFRSTYFYLEWPKYI